MKSSQLHGYFNGFFDIKNALRGKSEDFPLK